MLLPKIATKNKIRDAKICRLWAEDLKAQNEIAKLFELSVTRIGVILYKNQEFIKFHQDWEKAKRIYWLKKQIKLRGNSNKDSADLLLQLRTEIEGNKSLIDNSIHITTITKEEKTERGNRIRLLFAYKIGE